MYIQTANIFLATILLTVIVSVSLGQTPEDDKVKLAVLRVDFTDFSTAEKTLVRQALYQRLRDRRLVIMDEDATRNALSATGQTDVDLSDSTAYVQASKRLGVDFILVGALDKIGNFVEVTFRLYSALENIEKIYPEGKTFQLLLDKEIPALIEAIHRDMGLEPIPELKLGAEGKKGGKLWLWLAAGGVATTVVSAILVSGSGGSTSGPVGQPGLPPAPIVP